jgi:hypothetical protein
MSPRSISVNAKNIYQLSETNQKHNFHKLGYTTVDFGNFENFDANNTEKYRSFHTPYSFQFKIISRP